MYSKINNLTELSESEMKAIYGGMSFFEKLGCRTRNLWESVKSYMTENEFSNQYTNQYNHY